MNLIMLGLGLACVMIGYKLLGIEATIGLLT